MPFVACMGIGRGIGGARIPWQIQGAHHYIGAPEMKNDHFSIYTPPFPL